MNRILRRSMIVLALLVLAALGYWLHPDRARAWEHAEKVFIACRAYQAPADSPDACLDAMQADYNSGFFR